MHNPALLAVQLSNYHFMSCRLFHPDHQTLAHLNRWHKGLAKAIFLVELGNLHCVQGNKAIAMHRDWGESYTQHQARFFKTMPELKSIARSLKVQTLYVHENEQWSVKNV